MPSPSAGLVDIIREFLVAHRLMGRLSARYRSGELRFSELDALIGDHEDSVLFRLKERCHALFRGQEEGASLVSHQELLFDLAVGSLFHEAMKLREGFYQQKVYGPRVRALHSSPAGVGEQAGDESEALFDEFEKILAGVEERIEGEVEEVEALFLRTREQLRLLLGSRREEGHVVRCLIENRSLVEEVFELTLDTLLEEIYADPASAYAFAGRSYLASGYFGEAERVLAEAIARGGERAELERLCAYARGMRAYVAGEYGESVRRLAQWVDDGAHGDAELTGFAHAAVLRIRKLTQVEGSEEISGPANDLLARIASLRDDDQEAAGSPRRR